MSAPFLHSIRLGDPDRSRYTRVAMLLHWLVAALIALNITLILGTEWFPEDWARPVIDTHKSIGITVLGLAILRLLWRFAHPPPPLPASYAPWERMGAHLAHAGLYALIFTLPLTGWMHDSAWKDAATHPMRWFGLVPWPRIGLITEIAPERKEYLHDLFGAWHHWAGWVLYALFALHVLGALKHQWLDGKRELQRMWPTRERS